MAGDIVVEGFQDIHIFHFFRDKGLSQCAGFALGGKIYILVRVQKRKKFIFKIYSESF